MPERDWLSTAAEHFSTQSLCIDHLEAVLLRAPIAIPVKTSFGTMHDRPSLLVRLTERSGCVGYGEIWCNFPSGGADYKASLLVNEISSWLLGRQFSSPMAVFDGLTAAFSTLGLQTADEGAIAQTIAGIDQAVWDITARLAGMPLWRLFGGARAAVPAYASGIHPAQAETLAGHALSLGFDALKVKVGFDAATDQAGVRTAHKQLGKDQRMMIDANQAWPDPATAAENLRHLDDLSLTWIEEAMPANAAITDWQQLKELTTVPLAGGENLPRLDLVGHYQQACLFDYIQPDIGKLGGFTGLLRCLERPAAGTPVYCPHWLGGAVGLAASAQILAIIGGAGMLEVDINTNPLRDAMASWKALPSASGMISLPEAHGIGITPDLPGLKDIGVKIRIEQASRTGNEGGQIR